MKVFLATGNLKKIEEIKKILTDFDYEILSIRDGIKIPEVVEDGANFRENSQKKAVQIAKYLGIPAIADDSGLCVEALGGEPGVYSARYSGENATDELNNRKLISELSGVEDRRAKFVCVISFAKPNGAVYSFEGEIEGEIIEEARGTDGFGYDPHFYLKEYGKTFAEIPDIKNNISHRAKALEKLKAGIKELM